MFSRTEGLFVLVFQCRNKSQLPGNLGRDGGGGGREVGRVFLSTNNREVLTSAPVNTVAAHACWTSSATVELDFRFLFHFHELKSKWPRCVATMRAGASRL